MTFVRALMGPPEQRCWVDGEQVVERGDQNVGGAVAGAVIGGNSGSGDNVAYDRNVQRCRNIPSGRPAYWDFTYNYRGVEHRVQMSAPPGNTIFINRDGLPRP